MTFNLFSARVRRGALLAAVAGLAVTLSQPSMADSTAVSTGSASATVKFVTGATTDISAQRRRYVRRGGNGGAAAAAAIAGIAGAAIIASQSRGYYGDRYYGGRRGYYGGGPRYYGGGGPGYYGRGYGYGY